LVLLSELIVESPGKMIQAANGDILKHEVEALVNTANCVAMTGRGIALQFRRAFADNY
jgi:O-acetyl-ADP-ribose deacetylase (regulator of RNase III)